MSSSKDPARLFTCPPKEETRRDGTFHLLLPGQKDEVGFDASLLLEYQKHFRPDRFGTQIQSLEPECLNARTDPVRLPYQTLISSIIHKYAAGTLIDRRSLIVSETPVAYKVSADKKTKQKG